MGTCNSQVKGLKINLNNQYIILLCIISWNCSSHVIPDTCCHVHEVQYLLTLKDACLTNTFSSSVYARYSLCTLSLVALLPHKAMTHFEVILYNYWTFCRYIIWYIGMDKEYKDLGQYYHMYPWYFCTLNTNAHFFMYNFYWIILLLTRRREMSMYDMFGLSHMATVSSN